MILSIIEIGPNLLHLFQSLIVGVVALAVAFFMLRNL